MEKEDILYFIKLIWWKKNDVLKKNTKIKLQMNEHKISFFLSLQLENKK